MAEITRTDLIKKGSSIVSASPTGDVTFEPVDNTLFNYLVLRTYNDIDPSKPLHRIPVREVMEYLKLDRVSKLQASLERLGKGFIAIDYINPVDNEPHAIYAHYLSSDLSTTGSGMLTFAFDPILVHFLYEPKVFALISVSRIRDLKTVAAQKLYEIMSLEFRKKSPVYRASPDELRQLLQAGDKNKRFDNFKVHVLEKAISDVNAIADFDILVDYSRGGKGAAVKEVILSAVTKSHKRLLEAASVKSTKVRKTKIDPHTVDLLDGKTFEERGGPAALTQDAIEKARGMIKDDADINQLVSEWRDINRGRSLSDPDQSFLNWLELKIAQDDDPFLKDIEGDVFGTLISGRD